MQYILKVNKKIEISLSFTPLLSKDDFFFKLTLYTVVVATVTPVAATGTVGHSISSNIRRIRRGSILIIVLQRRSSVLVVVVVINRRRRGILVTVVVLVRRRRSVLDIFR